MAWAMYISRTRATTPSRSGAPARSKRWCFLPRRTTPAPWRWTRSGNVYIADSGNHAIEEISAANQQLATLVSGLSNPSGVAVDGQGNVYFSDTSNNAIDEWNAATQQVTTLAGSGLSNPTGVAVDGLGNVYFADSGNNAIKEWTGGERAWLRCWCLCGLNNPTGVAVDGQGNVYIADTGNNAIKQWNAGSQQVAALVSTGLNSPMGVAVDGQGNIYVADTNNSAIKKLTPAYLALSASSLTEAAQAGTGFRDRASAAGEHPADRHQRPVLADDHGHARRNDWLFILGQHFDQQPRCADHGIGAFRSR